MKANYLTLKQWLHQADPDFLALKRSFKTFIAILISLVIFWETPGMAMFAAIAAMLFSRSQVGFTIEERRFSMLLTGVIMVLLVFPITWLAQNDFTAVGFVFLASFLAFLLIGNNVLPNFPVVTILGLSVVTMAFSNTLATALRFSGMFLIILLLVFTLHFILWPTRPRRRLRLQLLMISEKIKDYQKAITAQYANAETGMRTTQEKSDDVRKSLGDFGRLWSLFSVKAKSSQTVEARYLHIYHNLGKIYDELLLLWQFRAGVWDSRIFNEKIIKAQRIFTIIQKLIDRNHADVIKPSDVEMSEIQVEVKAIADGLLNDFKNNYQIEEHSQWVAVINLIQSLGALVATMNEETHTSEQMVAGNRPLDTVRAFFDQLRRAKSWFKMTNGGFRLGLRSSLIIGSVMTFSEMFEPEYGYWPVLFAVLLIRPNLGISIKVGKERLLGTIAGGVMALLFSAILSPTSPVFIFSILMSVLLMIWFINLNLMVPMVTALTFMVMGVFNILEPESSHLVWLRIFYTLAIAGYVVLVSAVIYPEKARQQFASTLAEAIDLERLFFNTLIKKLIENDAESFSYHKKQLIRNKINQLNEVIDATRNEIFQENVIVHGLNIRSFIMRLLNTLQVLDSSSKPCAFTGDFEIIKTQLSQFANDVDAAFNALITALKVRDHVMGFPDLKLSFEEMRRYYKMVKYQRGEPGVNISRYWVNSTFIYNLRPLIFELEAIKNEIEMKMINE